MSKDFRNELAQMERLMNYGMNESKKSTSSKAIVEYSQMAADGKTYGILREGTKYYVKVAPKKNTQVLAEDYDYVGGYMNRKAYDSYTKASNALNLQLISVNESNNSKQSVSQYQLNESAEWQNNMTKEARQELNRFYQLNGEIDKLLNENVHYIKEDKNAPFTDSSKANYNKKNGGGNNGKQGSPDQSLGIKDKTFTDGQNTTRPSKLQKSYQDGKGEFSQKGYGFGDHNIGEDEGNAYQEKAKTMNENRRVVKLSEAQEKAITAWRRGFVHNDEEGIVDRSHGTEIGDTAPWTDNVNEGFDTTEWDDGLPGSAGIGDAKKYKEPFDNQNGVRQPVSEQYIFEVEMDGDTIPTDFGGEFGSEDIEDSANNILEPGMEGGDLDDDAIYNHLGEFGEGPDSLGVDFEGDMGEEDELDILPDDDEDPIGGYDDTDAQTFGGLDDGYGMGHAWDDETAEEQGNIDESLIFEVTLNDFGKHPAYRKKPMTLPQNADGSQWGEDWNDESTKGELPYGRQIGHSGDPFTEKVEAITNAVVTALSKKKD